MTQTLSIRPVIVISKLSTAWQAAQWQTKTPCGDSSRHIHVGSEHRHSYIAKAWETCCIKVGGLACVSARATLMVMGEVNDDDYILRSTPTRNSWGAETPWENAAHSFQDAYAIPRRLRARRVAPLVYTLVYINDTY